MEDLNEGSGRKVTNADCFRVWRESPQGNKIKSIRGYLSGFFDLDNCSKEDGVIVDERIRIFCMVVSKKWLSAGKNINTFLKYNEHWLNAQLGLPDSLKSPLENEPQPGPSGIRGRHPKPFEECAPSTKRKKVHDLLETRSMSELSLATSLSLRAEGHAAAATIVKDLSTSPEGARDLKSIQREKAKDKVLTLEQSLALYLDLNLSEFKYKLNK